MDKQRLLDGFFELVEIYSPSRHEGKVAAYLQGQLEGIGFTTTIDGSAAVTGSDTGNLIARLEGTAPGRVVLAAHMDCVEPCLGIEPVVADGIVRPAGATILSADDKAGVAAVLEAVRSVIEAGVPRPEIVVVMTTGEELCLLGAKELPEELFADGVPCFVFDAGGAPGTIVLAAPTHYGFHAEFKGKPVHAGVEPEAGRSAIQMAAAAIAAMPLGRLDECTTANVGQIEGGSAVNVVPERCVVIGECRSLKEERVEAVKAQISDALDEAAARFRGSVEVSWELDYPAMGYAEDDPFVTGLIEVIRQAGLEPALTVSGGGADTNVIAKKGARAITLGVGMAGFHSLEEHIAVQDLEDSARLIQALIAAYTQ